MTMFFNCGSMSFYTTINGFIFTFLESGCSRLAVSFGVKFSICCMSVFSRDFFLKVLRGSNTFCCTLMFFIALSRSATFSEKSFYPPFSLNCGILDL